MFPEDTPTGITRVFGKFRRPILLATCGALALTAGACSGGGEQQSAVPDEQAVQQQTERASELMRIGDDLRAGGDLNAAADMYRRAQSADPRSPAPPAALADVLRRLGQYAESEQIYRAALEHSHYSGMLLQGYGILMLEKGQPEAAIGALGPAVDEDAADPRVFNVLGIAYDALGDHAEAQRQYSAGLALAPENRSLRSNMALSLALQERYDDAIAQLKSADERDPSVGHNLAFVYGLAGRIEEAARISRQFLSDADVANNLAYYQAIRALAPAQRRTEILELVLKTLFTAPPSNGMANAK